MPVPRQVDDVEWLADEKRLHVLLGEFLLEARDRSLVPLQGKPIVRGRLRRTLRPRLSLEHERHAVARGLEFYNRKEIKDVLAYLRILMNPADEVALLRIINTPPRGIGATTVKRLIERAIVEGRRLMDILTDNRDLSFLGRGAAKVRGFGELILSLAPVLQSPPGQAVERVVSESGLRAMYAEVPGSIGESDRTPLANINELASAATEFQDEFPDATVVDWLEHTALLGDADTMLGELRAVTLMTLHSAKGLEFEEVHIVGVEDGILPFRREEEEADEEEERRLCFVGMTRAKQRLTLSHARYRMLRGRTERKVRSPFLDELPEDAVESIRQGAVCKSSAPVPDRGRLPDDVALWENGTLVRHPLHGMGKIVSLEPGARRTQVRVLFQDGDTRSMILEFAPLERVDFYEYDEG
ncbi:MAG: ATP-binding domain-containing protein [Planctomycetes bacterium]|nr:ATP-binding domain-containing protein [Planctomycetota bacterium]